MDNSKIQKIEQFISESSDLIDSSPVLQMIIKNIRNKQNQKKNSGDAYVLKDTVGTGTTIETKTKTITETTIETDPLDPSRYKDYVDYNSEENGDKYKIKIKKNNKPKIISEGIFRMHNRNERLPEYLSGILCTVNNLQTIMGPEWGYRIYVDTNFLRKGIFRKYNDVTHLNYDYEEFKDMPDFEKWKKLFDGIDEGIIFAKFLKQLNSIDYVEIYNVTLTDSNMIDEHGYPVGLFGTNYRFHASLDTTKDLVYMKDGDWAMSDKIRTYLRSFEDGEKLITYYFFPWYKPPTHAIIQYPFSIIAWFWGIKPKLMWSKNKPHYSFDTIINYFLNFDDSPELFFNRTSRGNYNKKGSYGSDEIILTDLIFSGFKVSDTYPYAQVNDLNSLLLLFIFYETYKDNEKFKKILDEELIQTKKKISDNKITLIKNWNTDDLDKYLFGDTTNKFCCIFPLYSQIPDKNRTKIFYMAYLKSFYELLCNNKDYNMNLKDTYYYLIAKYMKEYDSSLNEDQICQDVFNHTYSNNSGWSPSYKKYMLPNDKSYEFNHYYNIKPHVPGYFNLEESHKEPFWGFIANVIFKSVQENVILDTNINDIYEIFYNNTKYKKDNFIKNLWGPGAIGDKTYARCVENKKLNLIGGNPYSNYGDYGDYGYYAGIHYYESFSCEHGHYDSLVKNVSPKYNVYLNNFSPLLLGNKILNDNIFSLDKINYIINATISPAFHSVTWKILSCIIEKTRTANNFLLFDSGNALSYSIYNEGEFPWDDDIDIAYITDQEYKSFLDLLKRCIELDFLVYVYKKVDKGQKNWHQNMEQTPFTLSNISEFTKNNIWFVKISIKPEKYNLIRDNFKIPHYKFGGNYEAIPWIDVFPYIHDENDDTYKTHYWKDLKIFEKLTSPLQKINIFGVSLNKPANIVDAISKYKKPDEYFTKDNIYNHIFGTSKKFNYDTSEKQWLINYVKNHNMEISSYMKQIDCNDLIKDDNFKQKYLKYKQKYLNLKYRL